MPSGTLGQAALAAGTNTTVYTVPASKVASFSINFCNTNIKSAWVRLAIAAADTPTAAEWIMYDVLIPQYGTHERTGLVASAGKKIVCFADTASISVNIYGYEE